MSDQHQYEQFRSVRATTPRPTRPSPPLECEKPAFHPRGRLSFRYLLGSALLGLALGHFLLVCEVYGLVDTGVGLRWRLDSDLGNWLLMVEFPYGPDFPFGAHGERWYLWLARAVLSIGCGAGGCLAGITLRCLNLVPPLREIPARYLLGSALAGFIAAHALFVCRLDRVSATPHHPEKLEMDVHWRALERGRYYDVFFRTSLDLRPGPVVEASLLWSGRFLLSCAGIVGGSLLAIICRSIFAMVANPVLRASASAQCLPEHALVSLRRFVIVGAIFGAIVPHSVLKVCATTYRGGHCIGSVMDGAARPFVGAPWNPMCTTGLLFAVAGRGRSDSRDRVVVTLRWVDTKGVDGVEVARADGPAWRMVFLIQFLLSFFGMVAGSMCALAVGIVKADLAEHCGFAPPTSSLTEDRSAPSPVRSENIQELGPM